MKKKNIESLQIRDHLLKGFSICRSVKFYLKTDFIIFCHANSNHRLDTVCDYIKKNRVSSKQVEIINKFGPVTNFYAKFYFCRMERKKEKSF